MVLVEDREETCVFLLMAVSLNSFFSTEATLHTQNLTSKPNPVTLLQSLLVWTLSLLFSGSLRERLCATCSGG